MPGYLRLLGRYWRRLLFVTLVGVLLPFSANIYAQASRPWVTYLQARPSGLSRSFIEANYPGTQEAPTQVVELRLRHLRSRAFVVIMGYGASVITEVKKRPTIVASMAFRLGRHPGCKSLADAACLPELTEVPDVEADGFALMVRSYGGCGVVRWRADSVGSRAEELRCELEPRAYVKAWAECVGSGGQREAQGLLGGGVCVHRATDAGKICTDKSQCQLGCEPTSVPSTRDGSYVGVCRATDSPFGCFSQTTDRGEIFTTCVD